MMSYMWQNDWTIYALVFYLGTQLLWDAIVTPEGFLYPFKKFYREAFGIREED